MGLRKGDAVITTLDGWTRTEIVTEFNRLMNRPVTVYCTGELNGTTGVVSSASVVGRFVSLQVGSEQNPEYVHVPLTALVGVEVAKP